MLTVQHTQECLSWAFMHALAGMAGVDLQMTTGHDYGVDGSLRPIEIINGRRTPVGTAIDFQLKASTQWELKSGHIVYDLDSKNYNDIALRTGNIELILILLCLPKEQSFWLSGDETGMMLKNACYWHSIDGPGVDNTSTKRVFIPTENHLNVKSVNLLMARARDRELGL